MISEETLASLRTLAVTAEHSFRGSLDYAVTAPERLDPLIRELLWNWNVTSLPEAEPRRGQFLHSLRSAYAAAQKNPDWLADIERAIERRFAAPKRSEQGDLVELDFGQVPGRLEVRGRRGIVIARSPHLEADQWRTPDLVRALAVAAEAHPNAQRIRLRVKTEHGTYPLDWVYEYDRRTDAMLVSFPARPYEMYLSPALGLTPRRGLTFEEYLRGERSLAVSRLRAVGRNPASQR